jgi:hypothetical protein
MSNYQFHDNSNGSINGIQSSAIDYQLGLVTLLPTIETRIPEASWRLDSGSKRYVFDGWSYARTIGILPADGTIGITYSYGDAGAATTEDFSFDAAMVDMNAGFPGESAIKDSLRFVLQGRAYIDQGAKLYQGVDPGTGAGTFAGTFDWATCRATLLAWFAGANNPSLQGLATRLGREVVDEAIIRAPGYPVQSGSVQIVAVDTQGHEIMASADATGAIAGEGIEGNFHYDAAVGKVRFGDWVAAAGNELKPWFRAEDVRADGKIWKPRQVWADSNLFNCVTVSYLPVDADKLGINSARLPPDGKGIIFHDGDAIAIHHTDFVTAATASAGASVALGRALLQKVWVIDAAGLRVPADRYSVDLDTGAFNWAAPLNLAGFAGPFKIYHRIMHKSRIQSVDLSGRIVLRIPANRTYPVGSIVSGLLYIGDMQGRILRQFDQQTWTGAWSEAVIGNPAAATYNHQFPPTVSNQSTTDSYAYVFSSSGSFDIWSKNRGKLAQGISINEDYTLLNPLTGQAEITTYAQGWGGGWSAGNAYRIDVQGGKFPFELALCILEGVHTVKLDEFKIEFMGGV